jgi:two-component sensor histidine kinase
MMEYSPYKSFPRLPPWPSNQATALIAERHHRQAEAKPPELHHRVKKDNQSSPKLLRLTPMPEEPHSRQ